MSRVQTGAPTVLYRFFGFDDSLLYVGITHRLNERLSEHKRAKPWAEVARITLEHFDSREAALFAEGEAIRSELPAWNVVHSHRHPQLKSSFSGIAESMWPNAEWITGNGRYASVAMCQVPTVLLHESLDDAEKAWDRINRTGCGGFCHRDHWVWNLQTGFAYTDGWIRK